MSFLAEHLERRGAEARSGSTGRIRIYDLNTETLLSTPYLSISGVSTSSEQGLLGMAFHPDL